MILLSNELSSNNWYGALPIIKFDPTFFKIEVKCIKCKSEVKKNGRGDPKALKLVYGFKQNHFVLASHYKCKTCSCQFSSINDKFLSQISTSHIHISYLN